LLPSATTTLAAFLDELAARPAAEPALIDRDRPLTAAMLADESARLAAGLKSLGVGRGDRVALWLPDLPAWLATFFACARLGAIAVSVNTRFRGSELADIVGRSGCRVIVFWPGFRNIDFAGILAEADASALASLTHAIAYDESPSGGDGDGEGDGKGDGKDEGRGDRHGGNPSLGHVDAPEQGEPRALAPAQLHGRPVLGYREMLGHAPLAADEGAPDAGCVIFTTSGTTRAPKFVLHDQRTVLRHARDVAAAIGYTAPHACVLLTAPLCGVFGFTNALAALVGHAPLVMRPIFDGEAAAQAVLRYRVTHAHASDEMISRMLDAARGRPAFPSARFFGYATFAPGHADLPQRAAEVGLTLVGLYGMSEVHALCALQDPAEPPERRTLSGGRLVAPEGRVRARDPETGAIQPHGTAGELELSVPSRMVGYYGNPQATKEVLTDDGFLRTGDLGYTTDERSFVFLARMGDTLRLGGFLVSPAEIEETLLAHPAVAAAQVVGVETAAGFKAFAFVIPRQGATFDESSVIAHCAARIAKFKVPVHVRPIDVFPVTPGANATKIQKAKLRELAQAIVAADRA
jgi:fatty-acyl-CoA synthase